MKISKTQFIEYLRCKRVSALDELQKEKANSFVEIDGIKYDDDQYEELVSELLYALDDMEVDLGSLEIMLPYFNEIEILVGNFMKKFFGYDVINSLITTKQLKLECEYEDAHLFSYVDVFQETSNGYNLCEVKAKTTNTLWKIGKTLNEDDKNSGVSKDYKSIFKLCDDGICRLREDVEGFSFENSVLSEKEYHKYRMKLFDYENDMGRIILDISFQRFIAEQMYGKSDANKYYLGLLNSEYVFDGKYVNDKPFYAYDEKGNYIVTLVDVTTITFQMQDKVEALLKKVIARMELGDASKVELGKYCLRKKSRQCKYFNICWEDIPKVNSIFAYFDNHHGFKNSDGEKFDTYELLNSGIVNLVDVDYALLNREKNVIQKQCVELDREYLEKDKIKSAINALNYPLYHLDFESLPLPLPRFKGEKCYTQSLFQFSIHIEREPGVCDIDSDHYEFLATDHQDNRLALTEKMLDIIKEDRGSVVVYNETFEKGRIKELASYFPQYKKRLDDIHSRVYDLYYVLNGNKKFYEALGYDMKNTSLIFYYPNLSGSFSIKSVLPVLSDISYVGMDVGNGTDAMVTYAKFPKFSDVEFSQKKQALIEYCKQDTWAMVVILKKLRRLIN